MQNLIELKKHLLKLIIINENIIIVKREDPSGCLEPGEANSQEPLLESII